MYHKKILEKLKETREREKMSQRQLATFSGISTTVLGMIERCEKAVPQHTAKLLADILGVTESELY